MQKTPRRQSFMQCLVRILAVILIVTFALAIYYYPEKYLWMEQVLSHLGRLLSRSGYDNTLSREIFTIGFLCCSGLSFLLAIQFFMISGKEKLETLKGFFCLLMGVGALGVAVPSGLPTTSPIHIWGTGLFIVAFVIFNLICQFFHLSAKIPQNFREKFAEFLDRLWVIVIIITAVLFLISYIFWWLHYIAIIQKILTLMVCIAVVIIDREDM